VSIARSGIVADCAETPGMTFAGSDSESPAGATSPKALIGGIVCTVHAARSALWSAGRP
jgi:hypothetical protein